MAKKPTIEKSEQQLPTMADVAKLVGVSRQLVGLVFRDAPGVGAETAAKIRAAAKEIGYRPNLAAQSLRRDSSNNIGFMFHADQSSMQGILPAMYKYAKGAGYNLVLSVVSESHNENDAIEELLGYRCEGLIISASDLSQNRLQKLSREIPMVSLGRRMEQVRAGMVSSNGEEGIFKVTNHLIDLGHKDIAYVHGKDMRDSQFRLEGYQAAMDARKLPQRIVEIEGDFAEIGGGEAAAKLLKQNLPTAVVCNNDQSAFGLSHRLLQAGLQIPAQISITGYDDTVAQYPFLDLTTARQDPDDLARFAVQDLVARIKGEKYLSETYLTPATLVVRSSSAKPRKEQVLRISAAK
jgi:DNA-binding LacI/PurR family transcriptional regulator